MCARPYIDIFQIMRRKLKFLIAKKNKNKHLTNIQRFKNIVIK